MLSRHCSTLTESLKYFLRKNCSENICCTKALTPTWQHLLLCTDEVDDDGAKYEAVEEHDGLEASVAEESANDAKDEVERADGGSVRVVGANNFEVVLHHQIVHNSGIR